MARIPNNFHFVFGLIPQTEPFHLMHYLCLSSCIAVNKPEKIYFHYKHLPYGKFWDMIAPKLTLMQITEASDLLSFQYHDQLVSRYQYAHEADIIRIEALLKYGGVYADMDTLFVNKIPVHLYEWPCVMGMEKVAWNEPLAQQAGGSLCNALIMAEPGAAFLSVWLRQMADYFDGSWSAHSTFLPYMLSRQHEGLVHIEPKQSFFHFDWDPVGINNIFMKKAAITEGIYSIHLWAHLWWSPVRNEFTPYDYRFLTADYVAYSQATYASIAKRFLPGNVKTSFVGYLWQRLKLSVKRYKLRAGQ